MPQYGLPLKRTEYLSPLTIGEFQISSKEFAGPQFRDIWPKINGDGSVRRGALPPGPVPPTPFRGASVSRRAKPALVATHNLAGECAGIHARSNRPAERSARRRSEVIGDSTSRLNQ